VSFGNGSGSASSTTRQSCARNTSATSGTGLASAARPSACSGASADSRGRSTGRHAAERPPVDLVAVSRPRAPQCAPSNARAEDRAAGRWRRITTAPILDRVTDPEFETLSEAVLAISAERSQKTEAGQSGQAIRSEIEQHRGRAIGVRTAAGETVDAGRAVLADTTAPALYLELLPRAAVPPRAVAAMRAFQWDSATFKVDWALDGPIPWTAADARRASVIHVADGIDELTESTAELARAISRSSAKSSGASVSAVTPRSSGAQ